MKEIIISKDESNQRADKYLLKYFNKASKSFLYKMLRKKRIKLNKKRIIGHEILKENDALQIYMASETIEKFSEATFNKSIDITFEVVYEDDNILVCHKPVGLLSQPDGSEKSLVDEIIAYLIQKGDFDPEKTKGFRPGICNRLDRNTSGIVIAGKNMMALQVLNSLIANKRIDKHYQCIVSGKVTKENTMEGYLSKDASMNKVTISDNPEGHYIKTIYRPIKYVKDYTLLDVQIITGKSHQIRAHLSSIGHPLIGDYKYGSKRINDAFKRKFGLSYQLLHAYKMRINTSNGELTYLDGQEFIDDISGKFLDIANALFGE